MALPLPNTEAGTTGTTGTTGATQQTQQQSTQQQSTQQTQQQTQQTQATPTRPDYLPDTYWDATKNAPKADELKALFDGHTKRQAELITDPAKVELKTELKDRAGNPIEINRDEPLVKAVLEMAKGRFSGSDVNALVETVITAELASAEAEHQEYLQFGGGDEAKAKARTNAIFERGATLLGKDDQGKPTDEGKKAMATIMAGLSTKAQFEALEKLIGAEPAAAAAGGGGGNVTNIAESWYGKDGLSGPGSQKKAS